MSDFDSAQTQSRNHYLLVERIVELSESSEWDDARNEWKLSQVYRAEVADQCLCSHQPIKKICILLNKSNGKTTKVGNCCVNKFLGLYSDVIFSALERIRKDNSKSANRQLLALALAQEVISDWEHDFYLSIIDKRKFTLKQRETRNSINEKLVNIDNPERNFRYLNTDIDRAFHMGVISQWEYEFSKRTFSMRTLSEKQRAIKGNIETKMARAGLKKSSAFPSLIATRVNL